MMLLGLVPGGDLASRPDSFSAPVKAVATAANPRRTERYFMIAGIAGGRMAIAQLVFVVCRD